MKVGIYTRSATGDASQLDEQVRRCRAHAHEQGWEISAVWSDSGSGLEEDRRGLRALRVAMAAGQIQTLLASDVTRIGRDDVLVDQVLHEADEAGVTVVALENSIDQRKHSFLRTRRRQEAPSRHLCTHAN